MSAARVRRHHPPRMTPSHPRAHKDRRGEHGGADSRSGRPRRPSSGISLRRGAATDGLRADLRDRGAERRVVPRRDPGDRERSAARRSRHGARAVRGPSPASVGGRPARARRGLRRRRVRGATRPGLPVERPRRGRDPRGDRRGTVGPGAGTGRDASGGRGGAGHLPHGRDHVRLGDRLRRPVSAAPPTSRRARTAPRATTSTTASRS